jgi:hypothetical protein
MKVSDLSKPHVIRKFINKLDSIFDVVIFSERMEESLVLLKNLLCWNIDNVVVFKAFYSIYFEEISRIGFDLNVFLHYLQLNGRTSKAKTSISEIASSRIKALNYAYLQLYNHFRNKFSLEVKTFGTDKMNQDIMQIRNRTKEWFDFCVDDTELYPKQSVIIRIMNKQVENTNC